VTVLLNSNLRDHTPELEFTSISLNLYQLLLLQRVCLAST